MHCMTYSTRAWVGKSFAKGLAGAACFARGLLAAGGCPLAASAVPLTVVPSSEDSTATEQASFGFIGMTGRLAMAGMIVE